MIWLEESKCWNSRLDKRESSMLNLLKEIILMLEVLILLDKYFRKLIWILIYMKEWRKGVLRPNGHFYLNSCKKLDMMIYLILMKLMKLKLFMIKRKKKLKKILRMNLEVARPIKRSWRSKCLPARKRSGTMM